MEVKTRQPLSVRALSMLLSVLMIVGVFSIIDIGTLKTQALVSGDYAYKVLDDGTISITDYTGSGTKVVIPSVIDGKKVTKIDYDAFFCCDSLTSVSIPDGVTTINEGAFEDCNNLESVSIPNSVKTIGNNAFKFCTSLTSMSIPDSVTELGKSAFANCENLKSVSISNSITMIDDWTFNFCTSLTSVSIPGSVKRIGYFAFNFCTSLTSVSISEGVTLIENNAFTAAKLTSLYLPSTLTMFGENAFYGLNSLTYIDVSAENKNFCSIDGVLFSKDKKTLLLHPIDMSEDYTIPDGTTTIGKRAFSDCHIKKISIPDSVTTIQQSAFLDCYYITNLSIPDSVTKIEKSAFSCCGALESVSISKGIITIEDSTFRDCDDLISVSIPDSVTSIGNEAFSGCSSLSSISMSSALETIGDKAFEDCSSLARIYIPTTVTTIGNKVFSGCTAMTYINVSAKNKNYCSADGVLFSKDKKNLITYPNGISGDYTIPDGVETIKDSAFKYCKNLTGITIPNSVTVIEDEGFCNCGLKEVYIPSSVTTIGNNAFLCDLTSITVSAKNKNYCSVDNVLLFDKNKTTLIQCLTNKSGEYIIPDSVKTIGDYAFASCENITSISIPDSVTMIGDFAFSDCQSITSIFIPASVTTIKEFAFFNCQGLTSIYIPGSVTTISGSNILWLCDNVTVYGFSGSYIETYTKIMGIPFSALKELENNSTVTSTNVIYGQGITLKGAATGGIGAYQYAMVAKHSTASKYTVLKNYDSTATTYWKPSKAGTYSVIIKVKDIYNNVVEKHFTICVTSSSLKNTSAVTATSVTLGQGITLKGAATGGTEEYQYAMVAKHSTASNYTVLKDYNSTATKYWKPAKTGTYSVIIKVKDTSGKVVQKGFTITVKSAQPLANQSTVTATNVTLGQGITLKGAATGGTGTYQYAMAAKHSTASNYTVLKDYNSTATKYWKPAKTGTYYVIIKVKDTSGTVVQKGFTITVKSAQPLANQSTVTATNVTLGQGITLKGAATGGTGTYQYAMVAKHSTASSYTVLKNYDSTNTKYWKPAKKGTYSVIIKVKDTSGTVVQKGFTITVK